MRQERRVRRPIADTRLVLAHRVSLSSFTGTGAAEAPAPSPDGRPAAPRIGVARPRLRLTARS